MPLLLPSIKVGVSQSNRRPEDASWDADTDRTGIVGQSTLKVVDNLIAWEMIAAAGISSPIAPAKAFEWRLAANENTTTYKSAVRELQALLLGQHVDLFDQVTLQLKKTSLLAEIIAAEFSANELVLWVPKSKSAEIPKVVGASVPPSYPFFPSTTLQAPNTLAFFTGWLVDRASGKLGIRETPQFGRTLFLTDQDYARDFHEQIDELRSDTTSVDPDGPWDQALERVSQISI